MDIIMPSPRLVNATARIAVTTTTVIAIVIAIATVATTTRVPCSAFSFAPWRSPSAGELCSSFAGASFVGPVHPCFVTITRCHHIAPPRQCDLSCHHRHCRHYRHCHRHCGNHHHGATQQRTQPTRQRHRPAGGFGGIGMPSGIMRKGLGDEG